MYYAMVRHKLFDGYRTNKNDKMPCKEGDAHTRR